MNIIIEEWRQKPLGIIAINGQLQVATMLFAGHFRRWFI